MVQRDMERLHGAGDGSPGIRRRYLIVGPTRSGTTALHLLLAGHPHISVFTGELQFSRLAAGLHQFSVRGYVSDEEERRGRLALFDAVTGSSKTAQTRVLGAKTTFNAPQATARCAQTLREHFPDISIVVPVRRDMVAHYGSRARLRTTGIAHSWNQRDASGDQEMVSIDRWLLANSVLINLENYRALRRMSQFTDYIEVDYESFAEDNEKTYRRLLQFLDLDYVAPDWLRARRLHPKPESYIAGYAAHVSYVERLKSAYAEDRLSPSYVTAIRIYAKIKRRIRTWHREESGM